MACLAVLQATPSSRQILCHDGQHDAAAFDVVCACSMHHVPPMCRAVNQSALCVTSRCAEVSVQLQHALRMAGMHDMHSEGALVPLSHCCFSTDASQQDGSAPSSSSRPQGVLRSRSAAKAPAPAPPAAGLRKHTTPPHGKLSVAAAAAGAAAAPPLGIELPSALRHVSFSSGASAYTPSQLLEVRDCTLLLRRP